MTIKSSLEQEFYDLWCETYPELPKPEPQYRFVAMEAGGIGPGLWDRLAVLGKKLGYTGKAPNYRADFVWLPERVIVEIEGKGPGHESWYAIEKDIDKYNLMTEFGYRLLRFSRTHIHTDPVARQRMLRQIVHTLRGPEYVSPTGNVVDRINDLLKGD